MKVKIKEILKDKNKLITSIIVLVIIGIIILSIGNSKADDLAIAKALKYSSYSSSDYNEILTSVIFLRIILVIIVGMLCVGIYNLFHLSDNKNNVKISKKINVSNKKSDIKSIIKTKLNDKVFIIIVIILLLFPLIKCYKVGNYNAGLIENQKEILRLTEDIGSYNNSLGYSYREKAKEERKELNRRYVKTYGGYAISIISGLLIVYLGYRTIIIIKKEKGINEEEN